VLVPPSELAVEVGRHIAAHAARMNKRVMVIASTDLTHYGPRYGFTPQGRGAAGIRWAKEQNDQRMIKLMLQFDAEQIVPESRAHLNACGPGAVAAALAAARAMGASSASLLQHTNSAETSNDTAAEDAVGYAGMVFHSGGNRG
jgi:AmmeMemoRadiSam system protein B